MMVRAADWPLNASNPTHQISHVGSSKKAILRMLVLGPTEASKTQMWPWEPTFVNVALGVWLSCFLFHSISKISSGTSLKKRVPFFISLNFGGLVHPESNLGAWVTWCYPLVNIQKASLKMAMYGWFKSSFTYDKWWLSMNDASWPKGI